MVFLHKEMWIFQWDGMVCSGFLHMKRMLNAAAAAVSSIRLFGPKQTAITFYCC